MLHKIKQRNIWRVSYRVIRAFIVLLTLLHTVLKPIYVCRRVQCPFSIGSSSIRLFYVLNAFHSVYRCRLNSYCRCRFLSIFTYENETRRLPTVTDSLCPMSPLLEVGALPTGL